MADEGRPRGFSALPLSYASARAAATGIEPAPLFVQKTTLDQQPAEMVPDEGCEIEESSLEDRVQGGNDLTATRRRRTPEMEPDERVLERGSVREKRTL